MKLYIIILLLASMSYSADLHIQISPDTIYVGSLTKISITVNDLNKGEYPEFPHMIEQPHIYSVLERILHDHSVDYILQFWDSGVIEIPSLTLVIKKNRQDIAELMSDIINIPVFTNINNSNANLKFIKPMHELRFINPYKILLYSLIVIIGIVLSIYLWRFRENNSILKDGKSTYKKSLFNETLIRLESLQLPKRITPHATEEYYLALSHICRIFIKEEYYIRATEMTTKELELYFQSIGINDDLIKVWSQANNIADLAKYAGEIPKINEFVNHKENFIKIIKSFQRADMQESL